MYQEKVTYLCLFVVKEMLTLFVVKKHNGNTCFSYKDLKIFLCLCPLNVVFGSHEDIRIGHSV